MTNNNNERLKEKEASKNEERESIDTLMNQLKVTIQERDQLKVNLYLLGTNLKEMGFQASDQGHTLQRLGNDITSRMKLTAEQMHILQRQISGEQQKE